MQIPTQRSSSTVGLRDPAINTSIACWCETCGDDVFVHEPRRLLLNTHVSTWYTDSFILTGFRPVTHSVKFCFESLAYLHNETVNIYSHLIPASGAVVLAALVAWYFRVTFPKATRSDRLIFEIYLATSILGSFISGIYIGFYCEPRLQVLYWSMIGGLSVVTGFVVINPRMQTPQFRLLRTLSFIATGLSAFAPIIHAASVFPYHHLDKQAGLRYYYIEGVIVLVGVVFYISRFPEAWKPGKFDVWGASHQIFHVLVVLSAVVHLYGILTAFRWNYENPRCHVSDSAFE
ncbi:mPR-like GPCR protein [Cladorrhinum sp. PSN332]|nr:mPR-like GPCR protein [Cladorrhinum sp. PSN332]